MEEKNLLTKKLIELLDDSDNYGEEYFNKITVAPESLFINLYLK
jgi:hypothetical protein